ncbi:MAG TPA: nickel pincer cofactor biosynthesis protein LarC [Desulfobulbaceae bacterium]|nr:nickel pincer cofactor biosynthesis protein LarC [Desulfobulbaceae bacterium]
MTTPLPDRRIAFADCFSGISGDMLLGALLHAGLDARVLTDELGKLHLPGLVFTVEARTLQGIGCMKVEINSDRRQDLRTLPAILHLLESSSLDEQVVARASAVFRTLARAEAKVHCIAEDQVHFHEVGALDTIVDVVGAVIGLQHLGIDRLIASPLPLSHGFVQCAHGLLPLPAPAVCELLQGIPTYGVDLREELVTPTGAALIATLADGFGTMPPMTVRATGYGAGSRTLANHQPNLLRLIIGEDCEAGESQVVEVIETNIDDWSPEAFPHLCDLLFARGALDVTLASVLMKKGRPGFSLQVISPPAFAHPLKETILTETTAIGLRFRRESRRTLPREKVTVATRWGEIAAKKVQTPAGTVIYPEYEACREIALRHQVTLPEVYHEVRCRGNNS